MNTETVNRMEIVVYSADFAARQVGCMAGYEAGYQAAKAAMCSKSVEEMSTEQLLAIVQRRLKAERPRKSKRPAAMVQGKRHSSLRGQPRRAVPTKVNGGSQNGHYGKRVIPMPSDQELIFAGEDGGQTASDRIAQMDREVVNRMLAARETYLDRQRPRMERVH